VSSVQKLATSASKLRLTQGVWLVCTAPCCMCNTLLHHLQGSQWVQTERPATDVDPAPLRLGWLPEPGVRTTSDAGPPRARLLSSQQQQVSGGSGHAAAADETATGTASDKPPRKDAAARPDEPAAAQGSSSGSKAAKEKPASGEGGQPIAVEPASTAAGAPSESAAKDSKSQIPDSSSVEQDDGSEPDNSKPDAQPAAPALAQRSSGDGGDGERSGAAHGSQRPEEAEIARGAARQGARQPDPQPASGGKPHQPKPPKHRKAPKDRAGPQKGSGPASKPRDARPVSPVPAAAQTAQEQAPARENAQPATDEAGVPSGNLAAPSQQTDQPAADERAAPAQESKPAPAAEKKSWSRYSSHDPGAEREGTWSSYRALPNMHETHPHYHECGAQIIPGGPHLLLALDATPRCTPTLHHSKQSCTSLPTIVLRSIAMYTCIDARCVVQGSAL